MQNIKVTKVPVCGQNIKFTKLSVDGQNIKYIKYIDLKIYKSTCVVGKRKDNDGEDIAKPVTAPPLKK